MKNTHKYKYLERGESLGLKGPALVPPPVIPLLRQEMEILIRNSVQSFEHSAVGVERYIVPSVLGLEGCNLHAYSVASRLHHLSIEYYSYSAKRKIIL